MGKLKRSLARAERFRVNMAATIAVLVLIGTLSFRYPLALLSFLILGLAYAIYRIIKDRKKASTPP
jgi:F0F1-type ATP synthase assembly protein I